MKDQERRDKGRIILCNIAARNIKKTIMKNVKEAEEDISIACTTFHKRYEIKTGRHITTVGEFEEVTSRFSKLPKSEIDKLIKEGKEEQKKFREILKI